MAVFRDGPYEYFCLLLQAVPMVSGLGDEVGGRWRQHFRSQGGTFWVIPKILPGDGAKDRMGMEGRTARF